MNAFRSREGHVHDDVFHACTCSHRGRFLRKKRQNVIVELAKETGAITINDNIRNIAVKSSYLRFRSRFTTQACKHSSAALISTPLPAAGRTSVLCNRPAIAGPAEATTPSYCTLSCPRQALSTEPVEAPLPQCACQVVASPYFFASKRQKFVAARSRRSAGI